MRSVLSKVVRAGFEARLRRELPDFRKVSDASVTSGDRLYCWEPAVDLTFYISLQFHRMEDWFTVELAWTRNGRWPALTLPPESINEMPEDGDIRFRLGRLWEKPQNDVWWQLAPRPDPMGSSFQDFVDQVPCDHLLPKVESLVEDAVRHLAVDAMPYFRRIAAALGCVDQDAGSTS